MAIEIVDFPSKIGGFSIGVLVYQRVRLMEIRWTAFDDHFVWPRLRMEMIDDPWEPAVIRATTNQHRDLPSGKRLHNYGKSQFSMGKSTISMAIFNSFLLTFTRGYLQKDSRNGQRYFPKEIMKSLLRHQMIGGMGLPISEMQKPIMVSRLQTARAARNLGPWSPRSPPGPGGLE